VTAKFSITKQGQLPFWMALYYAKICLNSIFKILYQNFIIDIQIFVHVCYIPKLNRYSSGEGKPE